MTHRCAYDNVDSVSSTLRTDGVTVAMMTVLHLPPRLSCRIRVSFESRYGMRGDFSLSAVMTRPSVRRLWLMFMLSRSLVLFPPVPAVFAFSLPAKSAMCSLPVFSNASPSVVSSVVFTFIVKRQWEREEDLFMRVSATCRLFCALL